MQIIQIFMRVIDSKLSPPPNYANSSYTMKWRDHFRAVSQGKWHSNIFPLLRLTYMLALSWLLYPACLILKKYGYRFVTIDLNQIGSAFYLDMLLREDRLSLQTPRSKILILASYYSDANRYLLNLYNQYGIFIRHPFLKFILSPFFVSNVFQDNSYKFDHSFYTKAVSHKIWNDYLEKFQKPLISIPAEDLALARQELASYIHPDKPFVCLHVRDNGFYQLHFQAARNADINTYKEAIQYLINNNYAVVRLGDKSAVNVDSLVDICGESFFDYAHSDIKSERMDCYLLSHCAFFIGLASGPGSIPMLFGTKSCNVNFHTTFNACNFMEGDLTSFKKAYYKDSGELVPFEKLLEWPFYPSPKSELLESCGIVLKDNSNQEILDTVKEFLETPEGHVTDRQKKAKAMLGPGNYAYGAKGNFSDTILKYYFD